MQFKLSRFQPPLAIAVLSASLPLLAQAELISVIATGTVTKNPNTFRNSPADIFGVNNDPRSTFDAVATFYMNTDSRGAYSSIKNEYGTTILGSGPNVASTTIVINGHSNTIAGGGSSFSQSLSGDRLNARVGSGGGSDNFSEISKSNGQLSVNFLITSPYVYNGNTYYGETAGWFNNISLTLGPPTFSSNCMGIAIGGSTSVNVSGHTAAAQFTPSSSFGGNLSAVASSCGWVGFNWQQHVEYLPARSGFYAKYDPTNPLSAPPPFLDPPPQGYTYSPGVIDYSYPFYYDSNKLLPVESQLTTLKFKDIPEVPNLFPGEYAKFRTDLVAVLPGNIPGPQLFEFEWESNFDGTSGGVHRLANDLEPDPGSGSGGVRLLAVNALPVPEPGTRVLFGLGAAAIMILRCGRRNCNQVLGGA